jgi:hypothetical protein
MIKAMNEKTAHFAAHTEMILDRIEAYLLQVEQASGYHGYESREPGSQPAADIRRASSSLSQCPAAHTTASNHRGGVAIGA